MKSSTEAMSNIILGFISLLILFVMFVMGMLISAIFIKSPLYGVFTLAIPFIGLYLVHQMGVLTQWILEQIYPEKEAGSKDESN